MHGRVKKHLVELSPEEREEQQLQVKTAMDLFQKMLQMRRQRVYSQHAFDMTAKALRFHPEFPTLWGYRREILQSGRLGGEELQSALQKEIRLVDEALKKAQKVYSIWFHRKWVVDQLFDICGDPASGRPVMQAELSLCDRVFEADARNFHCWGHRAHVLGKMWALFLPDMDQPRGLVESRGDDGPENSVGEQEAVAAPEAVSTPSPGDCPEHTSMQSCDLVDLDLKLSSELINSNFSNYSAWHLRSILQIDACAGVAGHDGKRSIDVAAELDWVRQGIYTEPNDQSVWSYHQWLATADRGRVDLRITHCALLGNLFYVFFSDSVRISRPGESPGVVVKAANPEYSVSGELVPLGCHRGPLGTPPDRQRSISRRGFGGLSWARGWKLELSEASRRALADSADQVQVDVAVDVLGCDKLGKPTRRSQPLQFRGRATLCSEQEELGSPRVSPALGALVGLRPSDERLQLLRGELQHIDELLELEPTCRYAHQYRGRLALAAGQGSLEELCSAEAGIVKSSESLASLDPRRGSFYKDEALAAQVRLRCLLWLAAGQLAAPLDLGGLSLLHLDPGPLLAAFGVLKLRLEGACLRSFGPLLLLESLEELDLRRCGLCGDVAEVFFLPRLRRADLSQNALHLRNQPCTVPAPASLRELNLSGNPSIVDMCRAESWAEISKRLDGETDPQRCWELHIDCAEGSCLFRSSGAQGGV